MILDDKYLVLKIKDIDRFLSPIEKADLAGIIRKINDERNALGKDIGDKYFVINQNYPISKEIGDLLKENGVYKTGSSIPDCIFLR